MHKTAFFCSNPSQIDRVYSKGRREHILKISDCYPEIVTPDNFEIHRGKLQDIEAVFSTWGMWPLQKDQISSLTSLEIVLYGAGSVKGFASPLLDNNIRVVSAWGANAVPVAEFALAQILLSFKNYFGNSREYVSPDTRRTGFEAPGIFGETVVLLGAGMIGRLVVQLLKPFTVDIAVWDPFLSAEKASELGVRKIEELTQAFSDGYVISNHLANVPETVGLITGECFQAMREHATFINTGRGATVKESEMLEVFSKRPDLTALLDVTYPEPPEENSPMYSLPNIHLSGHIAGSLGDEVIRMADYMIEEFGRWENGENLKYEVTHAMLKTMA